MVPNLAPRAGLAVLAALLSSDKGFGSTDSAGKRLGSTRAWAGSRADSGLIGLCSPSDYGFLSEGVRWGGLGSAAQSLEPWHARLLLKPHVVILGQS